MNNGNGKSNGSGAVSPRPGSVLAAAPLPKLPVLAYDSPSVLMNCQACRYGGAEIIDMTTNRRRCAEWMQDQQGRCVHEMASLETPFDLNQSPTKEGWLSDMLIRFNVIGRHIMLELNICRALGLPSDPRVLVAGIRHLSEMHDVFKYADRRELFAKAMSAADGDAGAALRRFCGALALNEEVRDEAIAEFSDGDERLGDFLRQLVDAVAERSDAVELLERSEEPEE